MTSKLACGTAEFSDILFSHLIFVKRFRFYQVKIQISLIKIQTALILIKNVVIEIECILPVIYVRGTVTNIRG
jgi:hypothetical protein